MASVEEFRGMMIAISQDFQDECQKAIMRVNERIAGAIQEFVGQGVEMVDRPRAVEYESENYASPSAKRTYM